MGEDISTGFPTSNTVPEYDKIKKFKTTMGKVEPHILDNGEKGTYHKDGEYGWKLVKGENIKISIKKFSDKPKLINKTNWLVTIGDTSSFNY